MKFFIIEPPISYYNIFTEIGTAIILISIFIIFYGFVFIFKILLDYLLDKYYFK